MIAVARSSLATSLLRYRRSWGLWLLLLVAPVGARFMIARDDGSGIQIAIGRHLPVMTSAMLGVSLGIVVTTLLLPIGFLYLRSNTNRSQPWQVEEVTAAPRIGIALGRFGADVAVLFAMLAALTAAGWFLGALIVTGPLNIGAITLALWLVAAPSLMGLAALRILFDALPWLRRGMGDFVYFVLWITSIAAPAAVAERPSSLATNMYDFAGFVRPLVAGSPLGSSDFAIGGGDILPGRVPLDVMAGLAADGYVASRLVWAVIAILVAAFAGLVYRPHSAPRRAAVPGRITRLLAAGPPPPAIASAPAAPHVGLPFLALIAAEIRLIGAGRLFLILAIAAAAAGVAADYRHIGSPAALLLLIFALTAHAGRSEARGLVALTATLAQPPLARRAAFVIAGVGWGAALALPAVAAHLSLRPLLFGAVTAGIASLAAIGLAAISGSGFAARLVLLIAWYGYLSS